MMMNKSTNIIESFLKLPEFLNISTVKFDKPAFKGFFHNYSFCVITKNTFLKENQKQTINKNIKESKVMIIDEIINQDDERYLILCFEKTIMIVEHSIAIEHILRNNSFSISNLSFCFLKDTKSIFEGKITHVHREIAIDCIFLEEIDSLKEGLWIYTTDKSMSYIWSFLIPSISAYLIKKSYLQRNKNRIEEYILESEKYMNSEIIQEQIIREEEYVELRRVGVGGSFRPFLIYHIKKGELYVIKKPYGSAEQEKLISRESENYRKLRHPFLPRYYGRVKDKNYNVIEFIEGSTLESIKKIELTRNDKIKIIFELMLIFKYFRENELIYRDLKPNNVMIDSNKNIVLIDFDRLIDNTESAHSIDASNDFIAPEVYSANQYSYESDIYSVGKMIEYILNETREFPVLDIIIHKCIIERSVDRPSISDIILIFIGQIQDEIQIERCLCNFKEHFYIFEQINRLSLVYYIKYNTNKTDQYSAHEVNSNDSKKSYYLDINKLNHPFSLSIDQLLSEAQCALGSFYFKRGYVKINYTKAIHYYTLAADQNHPEALYSLGLIYMKRKYATFDINKSIHYLTLAAKQNHPDAQFQLGFIYSKENSSVFDINKSIHYLTLAAKQNHPDAQFYLGFIYSTENSPVFDINKSIHYYTLAANQNHPDAQFYLGLIYSKENSSVFDINKSIHYYTLAANQNYLYAQYNLGIIYSTEEWAVFDINKSIHYFSLAANQNYPIAQFSLGIIYSTEEWAVFDINKSIHYLSLAANQNHLEAQYQLGLFYLSNKYFSKDINKAIRFFSLAANQNHLEAQYDLGIIYSTDVWYLFNIDKSIHYLTLAAKQNHSNAQFRLGFIYSKENSSVFDINKSIHYLTLAAKQNHSNAQFKLGFIYSTENSSVFDINKSIHYFSLAANQKYSNAQFSLGIIYSRKKYGVFDINKSIHYYTLAANQNHSRAQYSLGIIYSIKEFAAFDINKSIHYFSLAANQNHSDAQYRLGFIYSSKEFAVFDINKSIHYFSLAANQNHSDAQYNLGFIYLTEDFPAFDINKSIHYFSLAANQNHSDAQYILGAFYFLGKHVTRDIEKAIYYLTLASNKNHSMAQYLLGCIYYLGKFYQQDIKKGRYYIMLSSMNCFRQANFAHGFLLHEGKCVKRNMIKAIHYYKEASSFNNQYAKNNLGIIYKHGFDQIEGRSSNAIVYFEEAIRQKNDILSMYNLAHIYIFDETIKGDINKSIELLIKSFEFEYSQLLLCLVLIKKCGNNISLINEEIEKFAETNDISRKVIDLIIDYKLFDESMFEIIYEIFHAFDFLYNIELESINSYELRDMNKNKDFSKYPNLKNISNEFYEGFGYDLL